MNTGQFRKGNAPWNKGLKGFDPSPETHFKLGNRPQTWVPVGTESDATKGGYIKVKVAEPNVWRLRSHIFWERANDRPLPKGWIIRRKDSNPLNDNPCNLEAMSRSRSLSKTLENPNTLARKKENCSKTHRKRWQEYRLSKYDTYYWQFENS